MRRMIFALSALSLAAAGCGESGPALVPVSGLVTLNGKPLEGAVITFLPDASTPETQPAEDLTGPEGNYRARTRSRFGVVPGKYHVVITKSTLDAAKLPEAFKDDPYMAELTAERAPGKNGNAAPTKIEDEFDCEVPPEGGEFDFDVKARASASKSS